MTIETQYNSWSDCVAGGGILIQDFAKDMKKRADEEKLYISYFCNEVPNSST